MMLPDAGKAESNNRVPHANLKSEHCEPLGETTEQTTRLLLSKTKEREAMDLNIRHGIGAGAKSATKERKCLKSIMRKVLIHLTFGVNCAIVIIGACSQISELAERVESHASQQESHRILMLPDAGKAESNNRVPHANLKSEHCEPLGETTEQVCVFSVT